MSVLEKKTTLEISQDFMLKESSYSEDNKVWISQESLNQIFEDIQNSRNFVIMVGKINDYKKEFEGLKK